MRRSPLGRDARQWEACSHRSSANLKRYHRSGAADVARGPRAILIIVAQEGRRTASETISISGSVAPGFEEVETEFRRNFLERGEAGAACSVYHRGVSVVDLWGGFRDLRTRAPWEKDTLVCVFSTTKGLAALVLALAHSRGLFDLDEPVARYWPEFAGGGKGRITIRQLLAHQAGLSAVDERLDVRKLADPDRMAGILARQKPAWTPGARHGYHGLSLGWYQNELIRRVDSQHRSLGRFFQDEIARPLGIEFYIGLPPEIPDSRLARIEGYHPLKMLLHLDSMPVSLILSLAWPRSLTFRSLTNPWVARPAKLASRAFTALEFPSATGVGQARAIARAFGAFAAGGKPLGVSPDTMRELTAPATPPAGSMRDAVLKVDMLYGFGFFRPSPTFLPDLDPSAFGAMGAGGSLAFADPVAGIDFAYVMNRMGFHIKEDPRAVALRRALYHSLTRIGAAETAQPTPAPLLPRCAE